MTICDCAAYHTQMLHLGTRWTSVTSKLNPSGAKTGIFRDEQLNTVATDALAHCVPSSATPIMMTSSNGNKFRVTGHLCGEFTGHGEILAQKPVTRSFDVFFDLCLNKRLGKQSWGWWFETLSRPLWHHCNDGIYYVGLVYSCPQWRKILTIWDTSKFINNIKWKYISCFVK